MNKMTKKFLGVVLSLGLLTTISFATQAKTKPKNNLTTIEDTSKAKKNLKMVLDFSYLYKNKNMEDELKGKFSEDKDKYDQYGYIIQNKTSAKDAVNFYIVMKKLFLKYKISDETLKEMFKMFNPNREKVKLSGNILTEIKNSESEKFKKLLTNLDNDIKNIQITEQDVKNAKNDLKKITDSVIEEFKTKYVDKYENLDLKKDDVLVEIAKDKLKKQLKNLTEEKPVLPKVLSTNPKVLSTKKQEEINKKFKDNGIKKIKETLKDKEALKKIAKEELEIMKEFKKIRIPNLEKHKKQFDEVKYDDVKNLTKDLKLMNKGKIFDK